MLTPLEIPPGMATFSSVVSFRRNTKRRGSEPSQFFLGFWESEIQSIQWTHVSSPSCRYTTVENSTGTAFHDRLSCLIKKLCWIKGEITADLLTISQENHTKISALQYFGDFSKQCCKYLQLFLWFNRKKAAINCSFYWLNALATFPI